MASYERSEKNKLWSVRFREYVNGSEVNKRLSGFRTKRDAENAYSEYCKNRDALKQRSSTAMTFGELCDAYLSYKKMRLKDTSYYDTENKINKNIRPFFANKKLLAITSADIVEWQASISGKSISYQKSLNSYLTSILGYAERHYDVPNQAKKVDAPRKTVIPKEMTIWEPEEFSKFYAAILPEDFRMALFFRICFCTGMRRGEALALTPADITTQDNRAVISISKSVSYKPYKHTVAPKNSSSVRKIAIDADLLSEIQNYITEQKIKPSEALFSFSENYILRQLNKYAEKAGVKRIRVHDLRHSHASYLISRGMSIVSVAKRLGHKDVEQTLNTYAHLMVSDSEKLDHTVADLAEIIVKNSGKNS